MFEIVFPIGLVLIAALGVLVIKLTDRPETAQEKTAAPSVKTVAVQVVAAQRPDIANRVSTRFFDLSEAMVVGGQISGRASVPMPNAEKTLSAGSRLPN